MVLDTMQDGKFFFKNTHENKKRVEVAVDDKEAPDDFFFVHIKLELNRLDQIQQELGLRGNDSDSTSSLTDSSSSIANSESENDTAASNLITRRKRLGSPQFPTPEEKVDADKRSIYVGQVFKSYFICLV